MSKRFKSLIMSLCLVVMLGTSPVFGASETFTGNDENHSEQKHSIYSEENPDGFKVIKINSPKKGGTYNVGNRITVKISSDGTKATVTSEEYELEGSGKGIEVINFVHMKGGNAFNCYYNTEGNPCDFTDLVCPNNNGGNVPEISHINIFYTEKGDSTPDEKPDEPQKPIPTGDVLMLTPLAGLGLGAVALFLSNKHENEE